MAMPARAKAPKPAASLAAAPVNWATGAPVEVGATYLPVPVAVEGSGLLVLLATGVDWHVVG